MVAHEPGGRRWTHEVVLDDALAGGEPSLVAEASLEELAAVVRAANRAVFERAAGGADLEGMGTTLCAAGLTAAGELAVVNVGDSRAYLLRDGTLEQLTDDHTVAADLVRRGELSRPEALEHPHRRVLTRAVGVGPTVEVDGSVPPVRPGDRLVLGTDGLFDEVTDEDIARFAGDDDLATTADTLVEQALARGGHDNIAVIVAEVHAQDSGGSAPPRAADG